jgi:hypothetical protein
MALIWKLQSEIIIISLYGSYIEILK